MLKIMNFEKLFFCGVAVLLTGCANHQKVHRGVVAMKISDSVAHVGLNENEIKLHDTVQLYQNKCNNLVAGERTCIEVNKGQGIVTRIVNRNYVAVEFDDGVEFDEGDLVQKIE